MSWKPTFNKLTDKNCSIKIIFESIILKYRYLKTQAINISPTIFLVFIYTSISEMLNKIVELYIFIHR